MNGIRSAATTAILLALSLPGCADRRSDLAGDWRGRIVTTSTRPALDQSQRIDDYRLTILPDGRFATMGLLPTHRADRAGQVIRDPAQPGLSVRVEAADYRPDSSSVTLTFRGQVDQQGRPVLGGQTQSARLTEDGRLAYRFFGYAMTVGDPAASEAISHVGLLRREGPTTRPDAD